MTAPFPANSWFTEMRSERPSRTAESPGTSFFKTSLNSSSVNGAFTSNSLVSAPANFLSIAKNLTVTILELYYYRTLILRREIRKRGFSAGEGFSMSGCSARSLDVGLEFALIGPVEVQSFAPRGLRVKRGEGVAVAGEDAVAVKDVELALGKGPAKDGVFVEYGGY